MNRLIFIILTGSLLVLGCNTTDTQGVRYTNESIATQLKVETMPKLEENVGLCMADTLSFLVGQPESALSAMEYPENTRVFLEGQIISQDIDPSRLNLVLGSDRNIVSVYCG